MRAILNNLFGYAKRQASLRLSPAQQKLLEGKVMAIGVSSELMAGKLMEEYIDQLRSATRQTFEPHGVKCIDLLDEQAEWIALPKSERGYTTFSELRIPNASMYFIIHDAPDSSGLMLYGAMFESLGSAKMAVPLAISYAPLEHHVRNVFPTELALTIEYWPKAFTGEMWEPRWSEGVNMVFTLPNNLK